MAKTRPKRRRAAVRSAKRSRNNNWWYALTALVVIAGIALIVYARETDDSVGPFLFDPSDPAKVDTHWHAALGVYRCDGWVDDGTGGDGVWTWPATSDGGAPARVDDTRIYAGLHSHGDGIIHMEPKVSEEAGKHATIGKYFEFGGWKVSDSSFEFLGTKARNGDTCGNEPGTLQWATGKFNGNTAEKQRLTVREGNPASYKLYDGDIVVIAFLPPGKTIDSIGNPPAVANLEGAEQREGHAPEPAPTTAPAGASTTTTPSGSATTAPPATTGSPTSQP
jgi:hypothetical protein